MKRNLPQNNFLLLCLLALLAFTTYAYRASEQSRRHAAALAPQSTIALVALPESHTAVQLSKEQLSAPSAQFDVSQNVIASGGGASTGGSLTVEGAIGQPAMGTSS